MNTPQKTTFAQWFWFLLQTSLLGLFILFSTVLRIEMINLHAQQFKGASFPWIANVVLFAGPLHLEAIYATLVFVVTTLVVTSILMKGPQKHVYMTQAPLTLLWVSLCYLTSLCLVFLLCFIKIDGRLYNSDNPPPPSPIPEPNIPSQYWFIASLVYLGAMLVAALWLQKIRKKNG